MSSPSTTTNTNKNYQQEPETSRTALVTGSSNGIGEAIVKKLAKLNYKLVVTGRSLADVGRVAGECSKLSPTNLRPLEIVADLENEQDVERLFSETMRFFNHKLDLLVNNAGFGQPVPHTQIEACYQAFKKIQQINLNAVVKLTLLAAPKLKETAAAAAAAGHETTSIINIGSLSSFRPAASLFAYSTSKAGLNMFTESMAVELAPLVRVNCISPGPIETKIIERSGFSLEAFRSVASHMAPLGRIGAASEVAEAVLFLADPTRAGYITGANLTVDGGCLVAPVRYD